MGYVCCWFVIGGLWVDVCVGVGFFDWVDFMCVGLVLCCGVECDDGCGWFCGYGLD